MSEAIKFPSASNKSKLSACPTTKIPQATDWIYQDFFNTILTNGEKYDSVHIAPSLSVNEFYTNESYLCVAKGQKQMPYQQYFSYTPFTEALHVITSQQSRNDWDNKIDYRLCSTSTDDQVSLPDLDNAKSSDEEEEDEEEVEGDSKEECDPIIVEPNDFFLLTNVAPVLIESTISSCTTPAADTTSFLEDTLTEPITVDKTILKKRKSSSSFSSLKSLMNVFNTISHKKSKIIHLQLDCNTTSAASAAAQQQTTGSENKNKPISNSISKKIFGYFKCRS